MRVEATPPPQRSKGQNGYRKKKKKKSPEMTLGKAAEKMHFAAFLRN
jgi:hypothetical protein